MILNDDEIKTLKELTQLFGPSGDEGIVREYLKEVYSKLDLEIIQDNLGSIIGVKKSKNKDAKKVLLLAHMDEVGFMVNKIYDNGSIGVIPLGGHNSSTLLSNRVILKNEEGKFFSGCISSLPPHLMSSSKDNIRIEDMRLDFGFSSKDEVIASKIDIGDSIVCQGEFEVLNDGKRLLSKAIDDRVGLALGIEVIKELKDKELDFDLYIGGSVQEEVGCRGGLTSSYLVHPDLAIVIDCSPSNDINNKNELGLLGEGVLVRVKDGNMIAFKDLIAYQINVFNKNNIKYQYFISNGGTDAGSVHKNFDGIKTLTYCLCARSIHTPSTILDTNDYKEAKKGLVSLLLDLNNNDEYKL